MKICILTMATNEYKSLADITLANKKEYCDKYNYDLINYEECNHHQIDKTIFIRDCLNIYDIVFWLGADTLITNFNYKIEDFFMFEEDIIIADSINGINADSILFRKSDKTINFVDYWKEMPIIDWEGEQGNMKRMIQNGYDSYVKIVSEKVMNAYDYTVYGNTYNGLYDKSMCWEVGDFILHLAGLPNNVRIDYFNNIINNNMVIKN